MIRVAFAVLAVGLLSTSTALAQAPSPAAPATGESTASPAPVKPGDRIICKRLDVSGTRVQLPKKCMPKKDWDSLTGRGKEDMDAAIRAGLTRNAIGGT